MNTQQVIHNWVRSARRDMKVAKILFEGKAYTQCLFWCHLVIEKLMKALVVQKTGKHAPYIHDLQKLYRLAEIDLNEQQYDQLGEMNSFNQAGRYHDELALFLKKCTLSYTQKFYTITHSLFLCLLKKIRLQK